MPPGALLPHLPFLLLHVPKFPDHCKTSFRHFSRTLPPHPNRPHLSSTTLYIINPVSGPPGKRMTRDKLHSMLKQEGLQGELVQTTHPGHASELAAAAVAQGVEAVVAVGGDGTVNEVARVLQHTPTCLGVVPRGSGNGLARHLGISMEPLQALGVLKEKNCSEIDSGAINSRPFFCTAGIGFDGFISGVFAASTKRGLATYARLAITNFLEYKPVQASIVLDRGEPLLAPVFVLAFANAAQYGNNAYIAPMADIRDGLLDVCLIRQLNLATAVEVGYGLMSKTLATSSHTQYHTARQAQIELQEPCAFHTDGEYAGHEQHFSVQIFPHSLRVFHPTAKP